MKMNVLVNDICRVMNNCSENLEWEEGKGVHGNEYMKRMQFSGYTEEQRFKALKRAIEKTENIENRRIITKNRNNKKSKAWYLKDKKCETVMYVDATPGEILKRKIEKLAKNMKLKSK